MPNFYAQQTYFKAMYTRYVNWKSLQKLNLKQFD